MNRQEEVNMGGEYQLIIYINFAILLLYKDGRKLGKILN